MNNASTLQNIEQMLQALLRLQAQPLLDKEFKHEKTKQIYEMTSSHTADEISKKLRVTKQTVIHVWDRLEALGLLIRTNKTYRKVLD